MTGADLIHLAGHLAVNRALGSNDEARFRSAASRAYYGAFHLARAFLVDHLKQHILRNHHGHRQVLEQLTQLVNPEATRAMRLLHELRRDQNSADYDLAATAFRDANKARVCVEMAESIRIALEKCRL
jgi:uncharacterized protein (UPF0332 family)